MSVIIASLLQALMSIGMRLLSQAALDDLVIWMIDALSANAKSSVTKELAEIVKKHIQDPAPRPAPVDPAAAAK